MRPLGLVIASTLLLTLAAAARAQSGDAGILKKTGTMYNGNNAQLSIPPDGSDGEAARFLAPFGAAPDGEVTGHGAGGTTGGSGARHGGAG